MSDITSVTYKDLCDRVRIINKTISKYVDKYGITEKTDKLVVKFLTKPFAVKLVEDIRDYLNVTGSYMSGHFDIGRLNDIKYITKPVEPWYPYHWWLFSKVEFNDKGTLVAAVYLGIAIGYKYVFSVYLFSNE